MNCVPLSTFILVLITFQERTKITFSYCSRIPRVYLKPLKATIVAEKMPEVKNLNKKQCFHVKSLDTILTSAREKLQLL